MRRRNGAALETATFATAVQHIDAVERKPLYHWRPGSRLLTLAAPGCSLRCGYCINYRLSQFGRSGGEEWTGQPADPASIIELAAENGCAIGFSYTEPSLAIELTLALAGLGGPRGIPVLWKSNGFMTPEAVAMVAPVVRAMNIDVKASDDRAHRKLTGGALTPVFETIAALRAQGVWIEISTPLIPGTSDSPEQLATIAHTLADIDAAMPWHLLRFTPTFQMAGRSNPSLPADLAQAREIGLRAGLKFVYIERALGADGRDTRCPGCRQTVVERGIWSTETVHLSGGRCPHCEYRLEGVWE
ncbi:AmmeMemoRadiSam system radical SAM enzyme [Rhizocola hellebori]|uniref:AmmeMemoRadiSam system radical SAM enzyme n=1 Tax=Rhizocola hellebori TaxID=1392758 RepID=A0A8J3QJU2_9ACTN|nr:AmmeMemoRadiSam system radical SAM enzyme [Rhizocola hellebori]